MLPRLRLVYAIAGVLLVLMGVYVGGTTSLSLLEALRTQHWVAAPGKITSARAVRSPTSRTTNTSPELRYTYTVEGRQFPGSRLEVFTYGSNTSYAADALSEFREGAEVTVYVDPAHPENAVLRRGANWLGYFLPLMSAFFVVFGIALLRWSRRLPRAA